MKSRLFIALEIPKTALDKLILIRDNWFGVNTNLNWETKEKLHITLKFLGDTEEDLIDKIISKIDEIGNYYCSMNLSINRMGLFLKDAKPVILWAGIDESLKLNELAESIDNSMYEIGYQKESRRFKPHLTLLRIKSEKYISEIIDFTKQKVEKIQFTGDSLLLVKSVLKKSGSEYETIFRKTLKH